MAVADNMPIQDASMAQPQQGSPSAGGIDLQALAQQQGQQQPQQQMSNGNAQLERYRQQRAAILGEAQTVAASKDPFAMDTDSAIRTEDKKQTQKDVWLASTAVAAQPTATFQQHEHENFMEHWNNDPAVKEFGDKGGWQVVDTLAEMVKRGDLSFQDAVGQLQSDGFTDMVDGIIKKHHSDNPHSMVDHPMKTGRGNPNRARIPTRKGAK